MKNAKKRKNSNIEDHDSRAELENCFKKSLGIEGKLLLSNLNSNIYIILLAHF